MEPCHILVIGGAFSFGVCMTEFQEITHEIRQLQKELNHLGSCTTKDLTTEQIAHLDERFFLALKQQSKLIARLNNKPEGFL
jgi:GTP-dependent phosphoenolpyruvate carboxykinase